MASSGARTLSRRRSQRLSTGKTSSYFEDDVSDSEADPERPHKVAKNKANTSAKRQPAVTHSKHRRSSGEALEDDDEFEEASEEAADLDDDENEDEFDDGSDDSGKLAAKSSSGRRRGRPPAARKNAKVLTHLPKKSQVKQKKQDNEDEHENEDEDEEDEESRVTIIPLPKLRDLNGIDYEPERIHPNTLAFLGDLKANNKRSWLKLHDEEYRRSLKDWESFVETITEKITEADETVPELPLKDVIFRIYRDVRFSKDPTPYKPHYSAAWSRTGRKGPYAAYYIHAEPGNCFIGGGIWCPDKDALARLRASVDERPHRIRRILSNPDFQDTFLSQNTSGSPFKQDIKKGSKAKTVRKANDQPADPAAEAIKAFCAANKESALKTKPKGFDAEHRDIELLKLKNYTVGKKFKDSDFTAEDSQERIMAAIEALVGFITFLNSVVMPDPGDDSDSDEEEEEEAEGHDEEGEGEEDDDEEEEEEGDEE